MFLSLLLDAPLRGSPVVFFFVGSAHFFHAFHFEKRIAKDTTLIVKTTLLIFHSLRSSLVSNRRQFQPAVGFVSARNQYPCFHRDLALLLLIDATNPDLPASQRSIMRENEALKEMKGYVSSLPARLGQKQTGDSMAGRPIRRSLLESESIAPTDAVRWPVTHEVRISPSYRQAQSDYLRYHKSC